MKVVNLGEPPMYDGVLRTEGNPQQNAFSQEWQDWLNELIQLVRDQQGKGGPSEVLNPDFHWSRINGTTPIVGDGELVDTWYVRSNGNTFSATPTLYTLTEPSSDTGAAHYININITAGATDFEIYQQYTNGISRFQDTDISFVSFIRNNNPANDVFVKSYIGFDTDNNGVDDVVKESGLIKLTAAEQQIHSSFKTPAITDDNQNNKINFKLIVEADSVRPIDIDIFFIKFEVAQRYTGLYVNHTLEKLKIDNA